MNPSTASLIGGIGGAALGVLGGIFGVWCSIRAAKGPRERAFIIKASVVLVLCCALFLAGLFLLPETVRWWLWVPYVPLLIWGILTVNRTQTRIRREETPAREGMSS